MSKSPQVSCNQIFKSFKSTFYFCFLFLARVKFLQRFAKCFFVWRLRLPVCTQRFAFSHRRVSAPDDAIPRALHAPSDALSRAPARIKAVFIKDSKSFPLVRQNGMLQRSPPAINNKPVIPYDALRLRALYGHHHHPRKTRNAAAPSSPRACTVPATPAALKPIPPHAQILLPTPCIVKR